MTTQPVLELIFAVGLPAVGSAIMFNLDASSGGTDIIAMVFRRYTSVNIGKALFISDVLIAASACIVFNMETGLFSLIGLGAKSLMLDSVMDAFRRRKCVRVITDNPNPITDFIVRTLHRSATLSEVQGAYTHEDKCSVLTVLTRSQALALRKARQAAVRYPDDLVLAADTVVLAAGLMPRLCAAADAEPAGDSVKPGRIGDATYSAYALARRLFED